MATPTGTTFAKVVAHYYMVIGDTTDDPDDLPDFVNMEGTGTLKIDALDVRNTNPGGTAFFLPRDIEVTVENGDLSQGGNPYVMVLRSGSAGVTPEDFTYTLSLSLRPVGSMCSYVSYGPYTFIPEPDPGTGVVDLAVATAVAQSAGNIVTIGPRGPGNLYIQPSAPTAPVVPNMWVQTGLGPTGQDFTIWIEDGL